MYILYFIYSFLVGVAGFLVFKTELIFLLLTLIVFEMFIYLVYLNFKMVWSVEERLSFNIFFFLGYFSLYLLYEDFDDRDFFNFNNNIQ